VPTFRPTGSRLHAARATVAGAYVAAVAFAGLAFGHPLVLLALLAGVVASGAAAGVGAELARAARFALPLALLVALVNPLVSREGLTVIATGPVVPVLGALDITLEALVFGLVAGLRVLLVMLAFALFAATVDPDALLRLFRRLSFRSALTASLATRLVPVIGRDAARLSDAYRLRAEIAAGGGRRLRRGVTLTRALAAGALDRAVDVAAALEVRGYALGSRSRSARPEPWSRHDLAFALSAATVIALTLAARLAGIAAFDPYPSLEAAHGPLELAFAALLALAIVAPFGGRRG
jgi:energy-coupling factor transport system permease protein